MDNVENTDKNIILLSDSVVCCTLEPILNEVMFIEQLNDIRTSR